MIFQKQYLFKLFSFFLLLTFILLYHSCDFYSPKRTIDLTKDQWHFSSTDDSLKGKAYLPGSIQMDLLKNKMIPPPYYRLNETKLQWIGKRDWIYQTTFDVPGDIYKLKNLELLFKGLDTFAKIFLNDSLVLTANNFFREWKLPVKKLLRSRNNKLKIVFRSPLKVIKKIKNEVKIPLMTDYAYVRKPAYHFGWDWGPVFVTEGVWRPVELTAWQVARIKNVWIVQKEISREKAVLDFVYQIEADAEITAKLNLKCLTNNAGKNKIVILKKGNNEIHFPFEINKPKLWWTNGLGEAFLYKFVSTLIYAGNKIDEVKSRTGLRTLRLVQKPDSLGKSFYFELNGVPVFAKGANYIPQDMFLNRPTKKNYEYIVKQAKAANMNMLRVWGGGIYEKDLFYDLCDENGILVWQDFMFACSMYPGDKEFLNNVKQEAIDNVVRLRNHPCIALWCGNNEVSQGWRDWGWQKQYSKGERKKLYGDYVKLFEELLPSVVEQYDSGRAYWPSSPLFGWGYPLKSGGDVHYWGVWHGQQPFENFNKSRYIGRFMSEYGFQSCPEMSSIKKFTKPSDWDIHSEVMLLHQKHRIGYPVIDKYIKWYFNWPKDFEAYLYVSQVLQAYGIGTAIEAHRRAMPFCMGTLYWQLNDCYPVTSWSSIDYYGKWKALHYKAQGLYKPVLISPVVKDDNLKLFIVSDKLKSLPSTLSLKLFDFNGQLLKELKKPVIIEPNTSKVYLTLKTKDFLRGADPSNIVLRISLFNNNLEIATKNFFFVKPKHLNLQKPAIEFSAVKIPGGFQLTFTSNKLAKSVFLSTEDGKGFFTKNFFDLIPDIPVKLNYKTKDKNFFPKRDIKIYSLYDSYLHKPLNVTSVKSSF